MATPNQSALSKVPTWGKFLIGAVAALLTAGVYWFFFYSDVSAKVTGAENQRNALRDELSQQQQAKEQFVEDMTNASSDYSQAAAADNAGQ